MPRNSEPPKVVNASDVEPIIRHPQGGGADRPLITGRTAGTEHILFGVCTYGPGRGSQWHEHEEEDVFYIVSGRGTMYYEQGGEVKEIALKPGDAVFSGYLRNYVNNNGDEPLVIVYAISPKDRYEKP